MFLIKIRLIIQVKTNYDIGTLSSLRMVYYI